MLIDIPLGTTHYVVHKQQMLFYKVTQLKVEMYVVDKWYPSPAKVESLKPL